MRHWHLVRVEWSVHDAARFAQGRSDVERRARPDGVSADVEAVAAWLMPEGRPAWEVRREERRASLLAGRDSFALHAIGESRVAHLAAYVADGCHQQKGR